MRAAAAVTLSLLAVGGCATVSTVGDHAATAAHAAGSGANAAIDAARRAAAPPQLAPVADPTGLTGYETHSLPQATPVAHAPRAPNSLWQAGSRTFFDDQRARSVGDILTVNIRIADRAEVTNSSSRTRSASSDVQVNSLFGLQDIPGRVLPGGFNPSDLVDASSSSNANGSGTVNREEEIELTVAAVVVETLPNGNLVIAGRQEVSINAEIRELTVTGVVRPEDISAQNTIRHDQIAEARIAYGGRGQITAVQRPRWGQRVIDAVSPW